MPYLFSMCVPQGLQMDGAGWDVQQHCLCEPLPSQPSLALPTMHLKPATLENAEEAQVFIPIYQREAIDANGARVALANLHLPSGTNNVHNHLTHGTAVFLTPP